MWGLVRSEFRKLLSHSLPVFGIIGMVVGVPVLAVLLMNGQELPPEQFSSTLQQTLQFGQIFVVIHAAAYMGQEYEASSLRTSLLCCPRRALFIVVKLSVVVVSVVVGFGLAMAAGAMAAYVWSHESFVSVTSMTAGAVLRCLLSWVDSALLAACLAVVVRSSMVPMAVLVPLFLGVSQILVAFIPVARFLPDLATVRVFTPNAGTTFLEADAGLLVQWVWVAPLLALAVSLHRSRDVR